MSVCNAVVSEIIYTDKSENIYIYNTHTHITLSTAPTEIEKGGQVQPYIQVQIQSFNDHFLCIASFTNENLVTMIITSHHIKSHLSTTIV